MAWLDPLLLQAVEYGASDLHLSSGRPAFVRVSGDMIPLPNFGEITADQMLSILAEVTPEAMWAKFQQSGDLDFAYHLHGFGRFRVNLFVNNRGAGGVFRAVSSRVPSAEEIGLPPAVVGLANMSRGLILVSGPTGSGKTTTMATLLNLVNEQRNGHIITIEDPIEYTLPDASCLVNQREVGQHTDSFHAALRAALREDPDVIMVGELRDLETTEMALEAAETGHLVFATVHTPSAAATMDRVIGLFPDTRQLQVRTMLAQSLRAVIAQTLCKRQPSGMVAAREILLVNSAVSAMIREGKTYRIESMMQVSQRLGMQLLNDSLFELAENGLIAPMEAYLKSINREDMGARLRQARMDQDIRHLLEASDSDTATPAPVGTTVANPEDDTDPFEEFRRQTR